MQLPQDLHIHTVYSSGDSAVTPEMTPELVARINHARVVGISDHFEYLQDEVFQEYQRDVLENGFYLGCEINSGAETEIAIQYPFDYFIYHCRDIESEYQGAHRLMETGKPVIVSHPMVFGVDLNRLSEDVYIEVNNRYVWRRDYKGYYTPWIGKRKFVIGSDAHQPNWLGQSAARMVANELGIEESLLFPAKDPVYL